MKKSWGIMLIALGVALFLGNICILLCVKDMNIQSAWLTLYSGWVSGIATIILGVLAVVQNRKYKRDGDENIQKQYDFEIFKLITERRKVIVEQITDSILDFCRSYDYKIVISMYNEIIRLHNPTFTSIEEANLVKRINDYYDGLETNYTLVSSILKNDIVDSENRDGFINGLGNYFRKLKSVKTAINSSNPNAASIVAVMSEIKKEWGNLLTMESLYIKGLNDDLNTMILQHSQDIEFIKKHYVNNNQEQNNG